MEVSMRLASPEHNDLLGIKKEKKANPLEKAIALDKQNKFLEAEKIYEELIAQDFQDVLVCSSYGMNLIFQEKNGLANALLSRAIESFDSRVESDMKAHEIIIPPHKSGEDSFIKVKKAEILNAIGSTWKAENHTQKARYWYEKAQSILTQVNPDIQSNLGTLHINEGNPEEAKKHLRAAIDVSPDHPQARWNLSLANLETANYEEGFRDYAYGKRSNVRMDRHYHHNGTTEWDGSPGKTVVVYGEQGIGDEIMFASCIADMQKVCKKVIFDCHKKLHRLFINTFPDIDCYPTREDEKIYWVYNGENPVYEIDAKIAIGDLPALYRKKINDFPGVPYISCSPESNNKWGIKLAKVFNDEKPIIGINWIGGHKKTRVEVRSLTLEEMLPVLSKDAHFVSLQYTKCEEEIFEFEQKHGIKIHHWPEANYSEHYDDYAGLVNNCDLVISNCSSVIHLAGSMGVPTWVLTPSRPAWRYCVAGTAVGDKMPWYQSVDLIRQKNGVKEWDDVVLEAAARLDNYLNNGDV